MEGVIALLLPGLLAVAFLYILLEVGQFVADFVGIVWSVFQ